MLTKKDANQLADLIIAHKIKYYILEKDNRQTIALDILNRDELSLIISKIHQLNLNKNINQHITVSTDVEMSADISFNLIGKEFQSIQKSATPNCMQIGASLQISELARKLYDDFKLSIPVPNFKSCPSISALVDAGFRGLIKRAIVCRPNGNILRVDDITKNRNLLLDSIVLSVELKCLQAYDLHRNMQIVSVPVFLTLIKNGLFQQQNVSVKYVPTYCKNELNNFDAKSVVIYVDEAIAHSSSQQIFNSQRDVYVESQVTELLEYYPHLIPHYHQYLVSTLPEMKAEQEFPSYHLYDHEPLFQNEETSYLFRIHSEDDISYAFLNVIKIIDKYNEDDLFPISDAVHLRFFNDTCEISIVSSPNIFGFKKFKDELNDFFMNGSIKAKIYSKMIADDEEIPRQDRSIKIIKQLREYVDTKNPAGKNFIAHLNKITPTSASSFGFFHYGNNFQLATEPEIACEDCCVLF